MAIGLAAMTVLAVSQDASRLDERQALRRRFSAALLGAAAIALAGALLALVTLRKATAGGDPASVDISAHAADEPAAVR